jgi:hypothetical protein
VNSPALCPPAGLSSHLVALASVCVRGRRQATAEDTGEDPVSEQVFESEVKAATEEKLREEEDDNNLPHGTPSWHPARAHHTAEEAGNGNESAEEGEFVMEEEDESFQVSGRSATGLRATYVCQGRFCGARRSAIRPLYATLPQ